MILFDLWLFGVILVAMVFAIKDMSYENPRFLFRATLLWPFSILVIALVMFWIATGWDIDVAKSRKMFGIRKPTNPKVRGIAVILFGTEIQMWKPR